MTTRSVRQYVLGIYRKLNLEQSKVTKLQIVSFHLFQLLIEYCRVGLMVIWDQTKSNYHLKK